MTKPTGAAAIRKTLKEKTKPAVAKANAEHDKLWSLWFEIYEGFEKAIPAKDLEGMELHEAAFKAYEGKAAVLLARVESLLKELDELQKDPGFVEELATFKELTETLRAIKGHQRNGLVKVREKVAEAQKAKQGVSKGRGDVAQQWSLAETQVAAATKSATAALASMNALWQKATAAVSKGDAKALASIKAQAKAFKLPLGDAAFATAGELVAKALLYLHKGALDADAVKLYERDGKRLSETMKAARAQVTETLRLQLEIDRAAVVWGPLIAKALKMGQQDVARLSKVAQHTPAQLMAELDATIKRLKLDLVAKDVHSVLKRLGAII